MFKTEKQSDVLFMQNDYEKFGKLPRVSTDRGKSTSGEDCLVFILL